MRLLGLDGCKQGKWVVASSTPRLKAITFQVVDNLDAIIPSRPVPGQVAVLDIPIGLCAENRECDEAARVWLRPYRHNSVFSPPCPEACEHATTSTRGTYQGRYQAASRLNKRHTGNRISRQAFGIAPRIWEVNGRITPRHQASIREGHPEVTFALVNGCRPLRHHKRTPEGMKQRRQLLLTGGIPKFDAARWRKQLEDDHGSCLGEDDIIDAAAMLWTAWRVVRGTAVRLPALPSPPDARGMEMAIWA